MFSIVFSLRCVCTSNNFLSSSFISRSFVQCLMLNAITWLYFVIVCKLAYVCKWFQIFASGLPHQKRKENKKKERQYRKWYALALVLYAFYTWNTFVVIFPQVELSRAEYRTPEKREWRMEWTKNVENLINFLKYISYYNIYMCCVVLCLYGNAYYAAKLQYDEVYQCHG